MQFNGPLLATYLLISVLTKPDEIVLYIIIQIQNINLKLNMKDINKILDMHTSNANFVLNNAKKQHIL